MNQIDLILSVKQKIATSNQTVVVAIDGRAGAGKTTLASEISKAIVGCETIHMDDLYRGWLLTLGPTLTRELESILIQLADDDLITYQKFDWEKNQIGEHVAFTKPKVLLLEGVGSNQLALTDRIDIKVWIEIDSKAGLERVLKRDGAHIATEMERFLQDQERHFTAERTHERSDFHIPGN